MTKDFLLEIGTEEIPAKFISGIMKQLEEKTAGFLKEQRLAYESITIYSTPRRLTIYVSCLADKQEDQVEVFRGPAKNIAFDEESKPTRAAEGFARGKGLSVDQLQSKEVNGVEYLFAEVSSKGKETEEVLQEGLAELLSSLEFPKSMRWGGHNLRFVRPLRWLLALLGNEVLSFEFAGIKSDRLTYGHRTLSFGPHSVEEPSRYLKVLRKAYVIADYAERVEMVKSEVNRAAVETGGQALLAEELLEEVVNLVEYPTAFVGSFLKDYLAIPKEILVTSMQVHQRYFPVEDKEGNLLPHFIGVRNGTDESIELVRKGNEKVLRARLADAEFFFREDRKKKLEEYVVGQKDVVYQARLGSLYEKTERVSDLATRLANLVNLESNDTKLLQRAAYLAKADLLTSVVYEFTELQGVMGREYALLSGEDQVVAEAIYGHHLPRFAGDKLPEGDVAQLLALADKIDNIVGSFALGMDPTGSQDPYGLRRQALGILHILKEQPLSVYVLIEEAMKSLAEVVENKDESMQKIIEFFRIRLKTMFAEDNFRYDVIDAVLSGNTLEELIADIYERVTVLQEVAIGDMKDEVLVVYRRTENLSRKIDSIELNSKDFGSEEDRLFFKAVDEFTVKALELLEEKDYRGFYDQVVAFRTHVDKYLDDVMIMVDDDALRQHRLSMLKTVAQVISMPADLGKLEG